MAICRYETLTEEERAAMPQPEALEQLARAALEERSGGAPDEAAPTERIAELN